MNEYIAALVDEFYQLGVRHAVFSPGSRLRRWLCFLLSMKDLKHI